MKITRLGPTRPVIGIGGLLGSGTSGGGGAGTVPTATGSNGGVSWSSNVASITVNGTTQVLGPFVNIANGSNTTVTVDQVASASSNTIRIHASGGAASFGSNATRVSEVSSVGAGSDAARTDHIHDGIGTITASSSNTMQRGTWNLRAGTGIALSLTDTDGDGEFDTTTIVNTGQTGGGGGSLTVADEGTPLSTAATTLDFVGAGVTATGTGATKTITIPGGGGGAPTTPYMTSLEVWLDADNITSPPSDGSDLTTWDDQSGNGHDFVGSGSTKPTYETNESNGLPVVRFATNDVLEGGDLSAVFPSAATLVIAYRLNSEITSYSLLEDASRDIWWQFGLGTAYMSTFRSTRIASGTTGLTSRGAMICTVQSDSSNYIWRYGNNTPVIAAASYAVGTVMHLGKGQNSSFVGDVMELLMYDTFLPDYAIAQNVAYLKSKWGIL